MKHHCHCGFMKRHAHSKAKRLGVLGITLMVLHLLYHVAQLLILPTVFVGFSHHHHDDTVAVAEEESDLISHASQPIFAQTAKYTYPMALSVASRAVDYSLSL